jgi:hypothetical protein
MIPLKLCKEILNKGGKKYSDEEIELIRDFLYHMGMIQIEIDDSKN